MLNSFFLFYFNEYWLMEDVRSDKKEYLLVLKL